MKTFEEIFRNLLEIDTESIFRTIFKISKILKKL